MARAAWEGHLGEFTYPPVYPLMGALAGKLWPADPFFLVDLVLFCTFIGLSAGVFRIVAKPALSAAGVLVLAHATAPLFVTPWTSSVSAVAVVLLFLAHLDHRNTAAWGMLTGLAVGLAFGARIGDVAIGVALAGLLAFARMRERTLTVRFAAPAVLAFLFVVSMVTVLHLKLTGMWLGHYTSNITGQGFNPEIAPVKLFGYLVNPFQFHGETNPLSRSLFQILPGLLLVPAGLHLMYMDQTQRCTAITFLVALAAWCGVYAPFVAVSGFTLRFGSLHYIKMLFPAFVATGIYLIDRVWENVAQPDRLSWQRWTAWPAGVRTATVSVALTGVLVIAAHRVQFVRLSLPDIRPAASHNTAFAYRAVDGDPRTRWDTNAPQQPGMEFVVDLGKNVWLGRMEIDAAGSPNDHGRDVTFFYSLDGQAWKSMGVSDQSTGPARRVFYVELTKVRWLKLRVNGAEPNCYWSIHELELFGFQFS